MAEGGDERNEENPFSFKKFVKKKSNEGANQLEDGEEDDHTLSVDLLDVAGSSEVRDEDRRCRDSERDVNPFSFKKFLQPDNKSKPSTGPTSLKTLDLANDLPDFVQDHYSGNDSPRSRPPVDVPLPDFALDSALGSLPEVSPEDDGSISPSNDPSYRNPIHSNHSNQSYGAESRTWTNTQPAVVPDLNLDINDSVVSDSDYEGSDVAICQANSAGGLPDFLPDFLPGGAVAGSGARPKVTHPGHIDGSLHAEDGDGPHTAARVHQLEAENAELRCQLKEARDEAGEPKKGQLSVVMSDRDLQQVKDAEDAAALENVIQQVEANLHTATQRALTAEAANSHLRQEVKQLSKKLELVQEENAVLRQDPRVQDPLREKTRYAASQLSAAAKAAEQHLRQLLSGVETLKMVSEVLLSAEKLSDIVVEPDGSETRGAEGGV